MLEFLKPEFLIFFSKEKKRNFIHLSRSKLHSERSLKHEFRLTKKGSKLETVGSPVRKILEVHTQMHFQKFKFDIIDRYHQKSKNKRRLIYEG